MLPVVDPDQLHARAGERRVGRQQIAEFCMYDGVLRLLLVHSEVIRADPHGTLVHAESARCVGLRVKVAQQHAPPRGMQRGGQIDGGRRLAHAAFLVYKRNDPRHTRTHFLFQGHPVQKFFRTISLYGLSSGIAIEKACPAASLQKQKPWEKPLLLPR